MSETKTKLSNTAEPKALGKTQRTQKQNNETKSKKRDEELSALEPIKSSKYR